MLGEVLRGLPTSGKPATRLGMVPGYAFLQQELQRRSNLLTRLRLEYNRDHLPALKDRDPLPKEWVERRLEQLGERWRQAAYY